jgi:ribosomal protein S18 acetylase RimI-like enzyme
MTNQMAIRAGAPNDLEAILPLMREFHASERIAMGPAEQAALERLLANSELGRILLAVDDNVCIGYLVLGFGYSIEFQGTDAFVDEIYVSSERRSQGIGARLLAAAEAEARRNDVRALHLEVDHENLQASGLYGRLGYRAHPRHLMTKWLDQSRVGNSPPAKHP